jgi:hypothetical protein
MSRKNKVNPTPKFLIFVLLLFSASIASPQTERRSPSPESCITQVGGITVDLCNHSFSFPATQHLKRGLVEVILCLPQGKNHESVFVTDVDPVSFEAALNLIGCVKTKAYASVIKKPEDVLKIKHRKNKPDRVRIEVEYKDSLQQTHTRRIEDFVWDEKSKTSLQPCLWHFKGIPVDEKGNPITYMGNNLIVSFVESDSVLEMDDPMLFDDNYLFVNHYNKELFADKNVIIHIFKVN